MDSMLIKEKTLHYVRNLYDDIIQVSENIEIYREMTSGLMDMITISNKMNELMKLHLLEIYRLYFQFTFSITKKPSFPCD